MTSVGGAMHTPSSGDLYNMVKKLKNVFYLYFEVRSIHKLSFDLTLSFTKIAKSVNLTFVVDGI